MNDLIGRVCVKLTGRESGRAAVIVDSVDDSFVLIDGNVKRRRCNIDHLEFLNKKINIQKGASTEQVAEAMKKIGIQLMFKQKERKEEKVIEGKQEKKKARKEKLEKNE